MQPANESSYQYSQQWHQWRKLVWRRLQRTSIGGRWRRSAQKASGPSLRRKLTAENISLGVNTINRNGQPAKISAAGSGSWRCGYK
jgi:hypothetical protein